MKVVVAALFLVIALAWVDTLEVITTYVFFSTNKNMIHQEHIFSSRVFATIFITLLTFTILVIIWSVYAEAYDLENGKKESIKQDFTKKDSDTDSYHDSRN